MTRRPISSLVGNRNNRFGPLPAGPGNNLVSKIAQSSTQRAILRPVSLSRATLNSSTLGQGGELLARERRALPDVFPQLVSARGGQQRCGRLRPHQPFREVGGGWWRRRGSDRGPFSLEQGEHVGVLMAGRAVGLLAFSGQGLSPCIPFPCPFPLCP